MAIQLGTIAPDFEADTTAGHITFHDAWITPDSLRADGTSGLVLDVMTPHHSDYYGREPYDREVTPPTEFDSPVPVPFLSVRGSFCFALGWNDVQLGTVSDGALRKDVLAFVKIIGEPA